MIGAAICSVINAAPAQITCVTSSRTGSCGDLVVTSGSISKTSSAVSYLMPQALGYNQNTSWLLGGGRLIAVTGDWPDEDQAAFTNHGETIYTEMPVSGCKDIVIRAGSLSVHSDMCSEHVCGVPSTQLRRTARTSASCHAMRYASCATCRRRSSCGAGPSGQARVARPRVARPRVTGSRGPKNY